MGLAMQGLLKFVWKWIAMEEKEHYEIDKKGIFVQLVILENNFLFKAI